MAYFCMSGHAGSYTPLFINTLQSDFRYVYNLLHDSNLNCIEPYGTIRDEIYCPINQRKEKARGAPVTTAAPPFFYFFVIFLYSSA